MSVEMLRRVRYAAIAAIVLFGGALLALQLGWMRSRAPEPSFGSAVIGSFSLVDQNGKRVGPEDVLGRPAAMFFGFTYCPDVCPTTLASTTALLGRLRGDADKLGVFFVTVDPERDTPAVLKSYLVSFDPRIRGLTGSPDQLAALAKPLGVYYARSGAGDGYTMDHTASIILLDAKGRLIGTIAYGESGDVALEKLRALVR